MYKKFNINCDITGQVSIFKPHKFQLNVKYLNDFYSI